MTESNAIVKKRRRIVVDDTPLAQAIGGRLRKLRLAAGLTQQQLAEGRYTKAYISALETGQAKPSMAALNFISERLGIPSSRLLADEPATWRRLEVDLDLASGRWQAAADGYVELLARPNTPEIRAELLRGAAEAYAGLDRGAEAASMGAEAAKLFDLAGRDADAAIARYWLAAGQYIQGNSEEAEALLREVLARVRAGLRVEPDFELRVIMALATVAARDGRHDIALAYLEEVRRLAEGLDDHRRATFLHDLAISYRETGDYEAAIRHGIAALTLYRATTYDLGSAMLENELALSFLGVGNLRKAATFAKSSEGRFGQLEDRRQLAHVLETRAQIALAAGDAAESKSLAEQALALAEATKNEKAMVSALLSVGRATRKLGDAKGAVPYFERAVKLARGSSKPGLIRDAMGEWADVLSEAGQHEEAAALLREALKAV